MKKSEILFEYQNYITMKYDSKDTKKTYYSHANKFINDSHPTDICNLTDEYLKNYLLSILGDREHVSSYNQMLSVIRMIYSKILKKKFKLKDLDYIKVKPKLKNLPDFNEIKSKILNIKNIKHRSALLTLLYTGLRRNELLSVRLSDIDRINLKILVRKGKGNKSNFVIINEEIIELLTIYYKQFRPKIFLFEGIKGDKYSATSLNNLVKNHIGKQYSCHWLRHLAITYVINKNIPLPKAKIFSRHESDKSIQFYYHYDNSVLNDIRECFTEVA